jgi:stage II sporulation protein R
MLKKKGIIVFILSLGLIFLSLSFSAGFSDLPGSKTSEAYKPEELIRFHVLGNSDSEEDQLLKYAVRDKILKQVAPKLASSKSLAESREIVLAMEEEILQIASEVVQDWGADYPVTFDYGVFTFPTKSYGNIILPGGTYEAVKIKIGKAEGANWWCVLFPPLCFVNVEESTTLQVDGKDPVPMEEAEVRKGSSDKQSRPKRELVYKDKKIGFFFGRFLF